MHYLLFYDVVDDYVERRLAFREAHLLLARQAVERGELVPWLTRLMEPFCCFAGLRLRLLSGLPQQIHT